MTAATTGNSGFNVRIRRQKTQEKNRDAKFWLDGKQEKYMHLSSIRKQDREVNQQENQGLENG